MSRSCRRRGGRADAGELSASTWSARKKKPGSGVFEKASAARARSAPSRTSCHLQDRASASFGRAPLAVRLPPILDGRMSSQSRASPLETTGHPGSALPRRAGCRQSVPSRERRELAASSRMARLTMRVVERASAGAPARPSSSRPRAPGARCRPPLLQGGPARDAVEVVDLRAALRDLRLQRRRPSPARPTASRASARSISIAW